MPSTPSLQSSSSKNLDPVQEGFDEHFRSLFEADKKRLYAYIYAYVHDLTTADDIFQETCLTLWQEFANYEHGSQFSKWANVIAFNRIRVYRRKQGKYQLGLSDDLLQEFSENLSQPERSEQEHEQKWVLLYDCTSKLSAPLQQVYQWFYVQKLMAQDIADQTGRSIFAIRKSIHKLRKYLFDCVEDKQGRTDIDKESDLKGGRQK